MLSLRDGAVGSRPAIGATGLHSGLYSAGGPLLTAEQAQNLGVGGNARVLPLGVAALDDVLPRGGLACGNVTELQVRGPSGAATSFALCACRAALAAGRAEPGRADLGLGTWCAFIDPTATLFAPGVAQLGLELERLLVVRPDVESIGRVAVRIAEANFVSVLVIDLRGAMSDLSVDERLWQRTIRRLALSVKSTSTCVLVITRSQRSQSLPLPTFMRLEFARTSREAFEVRVAKERTGRVAAPRTIPWCVFDAPFLEPRPVATEGATAPETSVLDDVWCRTNGGSTSGFLETREGVSRKVS